MITTLEKMKVRLAIGAADTTNDNILNQMIGSVAARFDAETGRKLERTEGYVQEFDAAAHDTVLECYPVESISKIELKENETAGWVEETGVRMLLMHGCVLRFLDGWLALPPARARVTYTGGYVFPPTAPGAGQTALPAELEAAAIEQVAHMFQLRTNAGVFRVENTGGVYLEVGNREWVPWVRRVLKTYKRMII